MVFNGKFVLYGGWRVLTILCSFMVLMSTPEGLSLESVRDSLAKQEDSIIYSLLQRAQSPFNAPIYHQPTLLPLPHFCNGSWLQLMLKNTEKLQQKLGRYESQEENPFFPAVLVYPPIVRLDLPQDLYPRAAKINFNKKVWKLYIEELPKFVQEGDNGEYVTTALADISCLQALSRRIHYGKLVAEAKFQVSPQTYTPAILAQDAKALENLITDEKQAEAVLRRVEMKTTIYAQDINGTNMLSSSKIEPSFVVNLYSKWLIPLTTRIEVLYLLKRVP